MKTNQLITTLEQRLNLKLSQEQKDILLYDIKTPVLVNACAGSGKTMLLILMLLVLVKSNQFKPKELLGITFSKRAQVDMAKRYQNAQTQLNVLSGNMPTPYFSTFHALFYRLLRDTNLVQNNKVISSYRMIQFYLQKHILYESDLVSDSDMLQYLFQVHGQMINLGYSFDGLTPRKDIDKGEIREGTKAPKLYLGFDEPQNDHDEHMLENYKSVVKAYNIYKKAHNCIDFSDMMILLYKAIKKNSNYRQQVQNIMKQFKVVFIDEFQDISKLQWQLMNMILSPQAKQHLVVIGDDDQSIYSFRGSDPRIILEYKKHYPQTKVFNLSTNYRTGGNILNCAIPLITSNHYRLSKKLLSGHKGQGLAREFFSNDRRYSANDILLHQLVADLQNPNINDSDIAILVRYNNSRMFAIDWLANHQFLVRAGKSSYILQNNYLYKTFNNLAQGLLLNQMSRIYYYSNKIGFTSYKKHISNVFRSFGKTINRSSVSDYIEMTKSFDKGLSNHNSHYDKVLGKYLKRIQHPTKMYKKYLGSLVWLGIDALTKKYFKYMLKNKYIDEDLLTTVKQYMSKKFSNLGTRDKLITFFRTESAKKTLLTHKGNQNCPIHILSLHQAKGLQFKYVYLFDLNNRAVSFKDIAVNRCFPPNISLAKFLRILLNIYPDDIKEIEQQIYGKDDTEHALTKLYDRVLAYQKDHFTPQSMVINKILHLDFHGDHNQAAIEEQAWQIYHNYMSISKTVEEERRLIYVGVTRAQNRMYLAYNRDANPLLNELEIPKSDKYFLEPDGNVLNYQLNGEYQQKISELKKKLSGKQ